MTGTSDGKMVDKKENVVGNCEHCGTDYKTRVKINKDATITCPHCKKKSENWDTPDSPQMAPSVVKIKK